MPYSARNFEVLFAENAAGADRHTLRHGEVANYRTRTIVAGDVVECEAYPIWQTHSEVRVARAEQQRSTKAQQQLNERNLKKRIVRRANATFTRADLFVTLTYAGEQLPDEAAARADMQRYIRRVRSWRTRRGLTPMQYIYVIEFEEAPKTRKRIHLHVLMSGMDRDEAERLWPHGRVNTRRLQPNERGLEGIVLYMLKAKRATRRCQCSRNISEPRITVADRKISRRKVERMASQLEGEGREVLEALYPGCVYVDLKIQRSDFVAGAYVYGMLHRSHRLPTTR